MTPLRILIALGVTLSVFLWIVRSPIVTPVNAALALATLWVCAVPLLSYFQSKTREPMPFLALTCCYYAVFFAFSVFLFLPISPIPRYGTQIATINVDAQLYTLLGLILMIGTYTALRHRLNKSIPHFRLPRNYSSTRLSFLIWPLVLAGILWQGLPSVRELPSIGQFIQPAGILGIGLLLLLFCQSKLKRPEAILAVGIALPIMLLQGVISGLLTSVVLLCGFLMVILIYAKIRYAWLIGVVPVLAVIAIYPGIAGYRSQTWNKDTTDLTLTDHVAILAEEAVKPWTLHPDFVFRSTVHPMLRRFSGYGIMTKVVDKTPSEIPYWYGETYRPILTNFVPRIFWPDKPFENTDQAFGHRYEFLSPQDKVTSINVPWIVEMYANFGRVGVLLGMTLVGAFLALMSAIFNRREMTSLEFVVGAAIIFPLVYPASNFSLMTGTLLQLTFALWIYFRFGLTIGARNRNSP